MKTLFTLLILVLSMSVFGQSLMLEVEAGKSTTTKSWDDSEELELKDNIILVFDDEEIKMVYKEVVNKYYVRSQEETTTGEGVQKQLVVIFNCVDSNGTLCEVSISMFEDDSYSYDGLYTFRCGVYYGNLWFVYYCNTLK